jgi:2-polyprenyl-3-methyl-5-hydroxy-6-metoxy-1,4-benzoquinol methylase
VLWDYLTKFRGFASGLLTAGASVGRGDLDHSPEEAESAPTPASAEPPETEEVRLEWELENTRNHADNLTQSLYMELSSWADFVREGNEDLRNRMEGDGRDICDEDVIHWCEAFNSEKGRRPVVLDFAAGPASSLIYLKRTGLAELVASDTLAREYRQLFELYGVEASVLPQLAIGELLDTQFEPGSFDLVHVRNALDHTQAPALCWLNLFSLVRVGGVLCHSHAVREGTFENWAALHQFDLFPVKDSIWIEDRSREPFSLSDDLPLETVWHTNTVDAPREWFVAGYRKLSDEISSVEPYRNALAQLRRAFERRSRWTFHLEGLLAAELRRLHPSTRPVPLQVDPDRI